MRKWKEITGEVTMDFQVVHPDNNMYLFEVTARSGDTHLTAVVFRDGTVLNQIGALLASTKHIEAFMNLQATLLVTVDAMIEEFVRIKDNTAVDKIAAKKKYSEKYA